MKVAAKQADAFAAKPDLKARAILVYGPDRGLVRERLERLTLSVVEDPGDPFRVSELAAADILAEPARLFDEAAALAMTGGRRVIRVREAGDAAAELFRGFLDDPPGDALVLVEGGELAARSSLRRLFESAEAGAALACYPDEGAALERLIANVLAEHEVTIEAEARAQLAANLAGDRALARRELEKLALYVGPGRRASTDDVMALIGDSAPQSLEEVALAAAEGERAALERALARVWQNDLSPVAVLRATGRHVQRLHQVAGAVAAGTTVDAALRALRPPVFWKVAPRVRRQATLWPPDRLATVLDWLTQAEIDAKSTGRPARAICARALMRIAMSARRPGVVE